MVRPSIIERHSKMSVVPEEFLLHMEPEEMEYIAHFEVNSPPEEVINKRKETYKAVMDKRKKVNV